MPPSDAHRFSRRCLLMIYTLVLHAATCYAVRPGDRLVYLDAHLGSLEPHQHPESALTTSQWIEDEGVYAAMVLSIDDAHLWDHNVINATQRLLDVIQRHTRANTTLFQIGPTVSGSDWPHYTDFHYGAHTIAHICPLEGFTPSDLFVQISHQIEYISQTTDVPVFRFPCLDSRDVAIGRHFRNLLLTPLHEDMGNVRADSSMLNINTEGLNLDHLLEKVYPQFSDIRYRAFTTTESYPFPFTIANKVWEIPVSAPTDWQMYCLRFAEPTCVFQNYLLSNNLSLHATPEVNVHLLLESIQVTAQRSGVHVFGMHPSVWGMTNETLDGVLKLLSQHAGKAIKLMSFEEVVNQIEKVVLMGHRLIDGKARLLDLDLDGFMDAVAGHATNVWRPEEHRWIQCPFPFPVESSHFVVLSDDGRAAAITETEAAVFRPPCNWDQRALKPPLPEIWVARDVDGDGYTDVVAMDGGLHFWLPSEGSFGPAAVRIPPVAVPEYKPSITSYDPNWARWEDLDGDGILDLLGCATTQDDPAWDSRAAHMLPQYSRCFGYLLRRPADGDSWSWTCLFDGFGTPLVMDFHYAHPAMHWVHLDGPPGVEENFLLAAGGWDASLCQAPREDVGG